VPIALTAATTAIVVVVVSVALHYGSAPTFVVGFVAGALLIGFVAVAFWAVDHSAGAHNEKFGTYGEEATAEVVASGWARRHGWRAVHNVPFAGCDVDHVVFGARGVLVIESKWANPAWVVEGSTGASARALDQVWRGARKIERLLRSHRLHVTVTAVVVQWGPGGWSDAPWTTTTFEGDIVGVRGCGADAWFRSLTSRPVVLTDAELDAIGQVLTGRIADQERVDGPTRARLA
jgi:hypothetical protein